MEMRGHWHIHLRGQIDLRGQVEIAVSRGSPKRDKNQKMHRQKVNY